MRVNKLLRAGIAMMFVLAGCRQGGRSDDAHLADPCQLLTERGAETLAGEPVRLFPQQGSNGASQVRTCLYLLDVSMDALRPQGSQFASRSIRLDLRIPPDAEAQVEAMARLEEQGVDVDRTEQSNIVVVRRVGSGMERAMASHRGIVYDLATGGFTPSMSLTDLLRDIIKRAE